jgi:hypothetical protein
MGWLLSERTEVRLLKTNSDFGVEALDGERFALPFLYGEGTDMRPDIWQDLSTTFAAGHNLEFSLLMARPADSDSLVYTSIELRDTSDNIIALRVVELSLVFDGRFARFKVAHYVDYFSAEIGSSVRLALRFSGSGPAPAMDQAALCIRSVETTTTSTTSTTSTSTTSTSSTSSTSSTTPCNCDVLFQTEADLDSDIQQLESDMEDMLTSRTNMGFPIDPPTDPEVKEVFCSFLPSDPVCD